MGRITLPGDIKPQALTFATVLKVGPWVKQPGIAVGDKVAMKTYTGTPIQHDGEEYLLVPYKDLLYVEG